MRVLYGLLGGGKRLLVAAEAIEKSGARPLRSPAPIASPHRARHRPRRPVDWAELAARAGYYDQAHFGHDFRTSTGLTPTRYLDVRRRFLREHPGHPLDAWPLPAD